MRIVIISPTVGDSFGTERIVSEAAEGMRALGHDVYLIAEKQNGSLSAAWGAFLIPSLFSLPHLFTPLSLFRVQRLLKQYLEFIKPDVVHLMDQPHHRIIQYLNTNYQTVFTAHSVAATCPASHRMIFGNKMCEQPSGWKCLNTHKKALCLSFLKDGLHRAHAVLSFKLKKQATLKLPRVIAISEYIRNSLLRDGFDEKQVVKIYNPVDSMAKITPLNHVPKPLIVSACRLVSLKGIQVAIRALKKIEHLEWTYWICGTGPDETLLKKLVTDLQLNHRIQFKGQTGRTETLRTIQSAQVFIQPNLGPEGFGLSVAEALSLGTPTITSQIPAFNELIIDGETGLLTAPGDTNALAEAIEKLLKYPEIGESLGSQSRAITPKHFSLNLFINNTLAVYQGIDVAPPAAAPLEWVPEVSK